jgi:2-oxoglutarate ferredoxin oxidoreductase subunit delta
MTAQMVFTKRFFHFYILQSLKHCHMEAGATKVVKDRKVKGMVTIDIRRCKGCELCIASCKEEAISLSPTINSKGYRYAVVQNDLCSGCTNCALVCPDAVITVYRTKPGKKPVALSSTDAKEIVRAAMQSTQNPET